MPSDDDGVVAKAYGEYKLATRYVLHWLQCQHQLLIPKNTAPLTSTKAFLDAARVLQKKEIGVPTSIISSLREAITKRRQVAIIYRALGAGHYEHDIFVKRSADCSIFFGFYCMVSDFTADLKNFFQF